MDTSMFLCESDGMNSISDMSVLNRKTTFEDLSTEVLFEIFDCFYFLELCQTFAHLNRRLDGCLAELSSIHLRVLPWHDNLSRPLSDRQLSCVKSLKFLTYELDSHYQHQEPTFFTQYPLKLFRQLRSFSLRLVISTANLRSIIDQLSLLPNLTFLNITIDLFQSQLNSSDLRHMYDIIFRHCTSLKSLKITMSDHADSRRRTHNVPLFNQPILTNIEYLNICQVFFVEFDCLLSPLFLPRVKSLRATIYDNPIEEDFRNDRLTLACLTNLVLDFNWSFTFPCLESFFKRTPHLKSLVITASKTTLIDHEKWLYFLSTYLLKLVKFHLHASDWEQRQWSKRKEFTDFQTSTYWLNDRNGTIQTNRQETLDEEGNGIDSISVTFTKLGCKNWKKCCIYCY